MDRSREATAILRIEKPFSLFIYDGYLHYQMNFLSAPHGSRASMPRFFTDGCPFFSPTRSFATRYSAQSRKNTEEKAPFPSVSANGLSDRRAGFKIRSPSLSGSP
jgi:hypothetical protein